MEFDTIHNHHERPVMAEVMRVARERGLTDERLLADVACVALNGLPPRYIRHDVDFAFYLTDAERRANAEAVEAAVAHAFDFVLARDRDRTRAA
ncbi:MAG: late competence development ComFB family protein [Pseudomonadota bacterium]